MSVCVSRAARISIGHLLVMLVCVSGQHQYRSVIVLSVRVRGRTYIDRPSPCHISLCFGTAPISIGYCLVNWSSEPHLYRSTISLSYQFMFRDRTYIDRSLSCQLEFGAAPISIDHLLVMSVCVSGAAPISIGHLLLISVCVSGQHLYRSVIVLSVRVRGRTYIDRPSPCHISLCFWDRTYIDRSSSY